jgi:hypothetical protein
MDLPVWQVVRDELRPFGFELVAVAMDTDGAAAAGPWIDAAKTTYPQLLDPEHSLGALLGITNVPMGVCIDEEGVLVRPAEPCFAPRPRGTSLPKLPDDAPQRMKDMLAEAAKLDVDTQAYAAALRDWVRHGRASAFALSPDGVVRRSAPRPPEVSRAAASFELGQHLHRTGRVDAAPVLPRGAPPATRELTRRQAWSMVDPLQGPTEHYDSDWPSDARSPQNYYPKPEM